MRGACARRSGATRRIAFWGMLAALLAGLVAAAPIAQPPAYHDFVDTRTLLGVPHAWNLLSNAVFVVVGGMGLARVLGRGGEATGAARAGWCALFAGTLLVGPGSAWYHFAPTDATLVWDRVAIGIAFAGFFSALVAEHVDARFGRRLLWPGVAFALAAIGWWRATGDLSLWIWVQAGPMLAIVLVAVLFAPGRDGRYLLASLACYVVAKAFELGDAPVMAWTGGLTGGHALKHLAAAAGAACLWAMLGRRVRRDGAG